MHVLYVTSIYPPDNGWGGIGTYVHHMARSLASIGHSATVLCGIGAQGPRQITDGPLTVLRELSTDRLRGQTLREEIAETAYRIVQSRAIDLVEFGEYGAEGLEFQRQHPQVPTVVRLHCCTRLAVQGDDPWYKRVVRRFAANAAMLAADKLEKETTGRATAVSACSHWVLSTNRAAGWNLPTNTSVIFNPIVSSHPPAPADDTKDANPRVLSLGRLCRLKGSDLFPQIVRRVVAAIPDVRFDFIGQDCRKDNHTSWQQWIMGTLPHNCRNNVQFAGGVAHPDVIQHLLPRHSVAFFASVHEAMPYSHLECMDAGLACVLASGGGAQEIGEHGRSVIRTPRNPRKIAQALIHLLKDPALRARIGQGARQRIADTFAAKRIAHQMHEFYLRTLEFAQEHKPWITVGTQPG